MLPGSRRGSCQDPRPPWPAESASDPGRSAPSTSSTASPNPDFLTVATPGAGKTTFALCAAISDMAANPGRRLIVVAPTSHLKLQWADAAARLGVHLEPRWSATGGRLPADVHGIVTTYQQVASNPEAIRPLAARSLAVLDEVHHAGDERAWGDAVRRAFEVSPRRLSLSGTPFRSDTRAIPFVSYVLDEARPDFEYGYADALADGRVVRPVYFPRVNGFMEWVAPDGTTNAAGFDDALDRAASAQRLRTALSLEGEWLATVLLQANERLARIRKVQPDAGGLVIAADQDHAKGIADILRYRCGRKATVAVSDDPTSARVRIARFAAGNDPWIVAVRMVSEGVDIPRLRVGVYATTTTTDLFFRQAVGPLRALDPGRAPAEGLPVHPRRPPAAHVGQPDRRRPAPQPAQARPRTPPGSRLAADDGSAFDELRHEDDTGRAAVDVRRAVGRRDRRRRGVVGVPPRRRGARPPRPRRRRRGSWRSTAPSTSPCRCCPAAASRPLDGDGDGNGNGNGHGAAAAQPLPAPPRAARPQRRASPRSWPAARG